VLKVRERGKFYLRRIHLQTLTWQELQEKILEKWKDDEVPVGEIVNVYELWDKYHTPITRDEQVMQLQDGHELQIEFSRPSSQKRHSYTNWYNEKIKN
jgi:hypothetical protein